MIPPVTDSSQALSRVVELGIRVGLLLFLVVLCFRVVSPFLYPVLWGVIIAVALHPGYVWLAHKMGDHHKVAAVAITLLGLTLLIIPSFMLIGSMIDGATTVAAKLQNGELSIPPPPVSLATLPVIGEPLSSIWQLAFENIEEALTKFSPQLKQLGNKVLGLAAGAGFELLQFLLSIIIAGALLINAEAGARMAAQLAHRVLPERGAEFIELAESTVRSVATGILGVALFQSLLAGLGFLVAGVPAAGLWTLACLLLGVVQIGIIPVVIPILIYMFSVTDSTTAVALTIWCVLIMPIDNILKPIFLGRGAKTPTLVVFIGAIGGFITAGLIGLFLGAVVLSLGYRLFVAWLNNGAVETTPQ